MVRGRGGNFMISQLRKTPIKIEGGLIVCNCHIINELYLSQSLDIDWICFVCTMYLICTLEVSAMVVGDKTPLCSQNDST